MKLSGVTESSRLHGSNVFRHVTQKLIGCLKTAKASSMHTFFWLRLISSLSSPTNSIQVPVWLTTSDHIYEWASDSKWYTAMILHTNNVVLCPGCASWYLFLLLILRSETEFYMKHCTLIGLENGIAVMKSQPNEDFRREKRFQAPCNASTASRFSIVSDDHALSVKHFLFLQNEQKWFLK